MRVSVRVIGERINRLFDSPISSARFKDSNPIDRRHGIWRKRHRLTFPIWRTARHFFPSPPLYELRRTWGHEEIRLSFINSMVFLAIPYNGDILEPDAEESLLDNTQIYRAFDELKSCFELVEDLNLNTRIWSKR